MNQIKLEVKNLSFQYNPKTTFEKTAIKGISFALPQGEFTGLIGHTGSGKSTLIQHLNALVKPTSGQVLLDGVDIHTDKSKLKEIRQRVGLVFQYPEHQLFEMTVFKDVAYGPENLSLPKDEVKKRVMDALAIVGLGQELFEKSPFELSGGQKRRVAIAGVLAMKPEVLILDEPTAGLDPRGRDEILSNIKKMHSELGINVILVSHSMEDVSKLADRLLVMNRGELLYYDKPSEIFSHVEKLEEIGLAVPQVTYLMRALHQKGYDVAQNLHDVEAALLAIERIL